MSKLNCLFFGDFVVAPKLNKLIDSWQSVRELVIAISMDV